MSCKKMTNRGEELRLKLSGRSHRFASVVLSVVISRGEKVDSVTDVTFPNQTVRQAHEQRLALASDQELRRAAEAVVDAAIWRRRLRSETLGAEPDVSEQTRLSLIELVYRDPSLTSYLFRDEAWERH